MKRLFVVLLAMVMMLSACGQSTNTQEETLSWQEQYDLGIRYLSEGNYEEAIVAFAAAIEIDPKRMEAYQGLSDTYFALGDSAKALEVWELVSSDSLDEESRAKFSEQTTRYEELKAFWDSGEYGVRFTRVVYDVDSFLAGTETAFSVTVLYRCPASSENMIRIDVPNGRQWVGSNSVQGYGVETYSFNAIPTPTEGKYYEIRANLYQLLDSDISDVVGWNSVYVTPQGELTDHAAPLNKYGGTEFIYRFEYYAYEEMTDAERRFIDTVGSAVINGNINSLQVLFDEYTWDFSLADGNHTTIWNGYKMHIVFHPYEDDEVGDRTGFLDVEMRPENGIGYIVGVYHTFAVTTLDRDNWWDDYYATTWGTCLCVDWQWNGEVLIEEERKSLWCSSDGYANDETEHVVETGTMENSLRDGTFVRTEHNQSIWSKFEYREDPTDTTTERTKVYEDGVLLSDNGVAPTEWSGSADIKGVQVSGAVSGAEVDDQTKNQIKSDWFYW